MTIVLAAAAAALFGCGTFLLLQRQLTRVIIGLALLAHGANLLIIISAGGRGEPTFVGTAAAGDLLDPLPQAFILTAIVISFGVTGFLLALAYRSWVLTHNDEVQDDIEDRLVARRTEAEDVADALAAAAETDLGDGDEAEPAPDEAPTGPGAPR